MSVTSPQSVQRELEEFYGHLAAENLQPLWRQSADLQLTQPRPATQPYRWSGETIRRLAADAGRLVGVDLAGDRRVLSLANPGLGGQPYASSTLWAAVQYLGPHESAPAHRHSQGALRFVLEGSGTWTTVNGDACDMFPGDVVLTPAWTWHDHNNGGDAPMLWFDGLDLPLVDLLDAPFFERYPGGPRQSPGGRNLSEAAYSSVDYPGLSARAGQPGEEEAHSPLLVYRWQRTDRWLSSRLAATGGGFAELDFVSPRTGRAALPTLGCHMMRIAAGRSTTARRKVGSSVYVVRQGEGHSVVGEVDLPWRAGDMFVTPSWAAVQHHAEATSDLFSISDRPALEALHLYREEEISTMPGPAAGQ